MSNLAIHTNKVLESLPKEQRRFVELNRTGKVSQADDNTLYRYILGQIAAIHAITGQGIADEQQERAEFQHMANILTEDAKKYYPNASLLEIGEALNIGARKVYGKNTDLNIATFNVWIKSFLEDEKRNESLTKASAMLAEKPWLPKEPDDEEKEKIAQREFDKCLNEFKEKGSIIEYYGASSIYDWCDRKGLIKLSIEEKKAIYTEAEQEEYARLNTQRANASTAMLRETVKKIDLQIEELIGNTEPIKVLAKKIALQQYFKTL